MARTVSKSLFKTKALNYFREVEQSGKAIIITDRGKPVLKLVPYTEKPEVWLKPLRGSVKKYLKPTEPVSAEESEAMR
jgi:prevent-host-death family protein